MKKNTDKKTSAAQEEATEIIKRLKAAMRSSSATETSEDDSCDCPGCTLRRQLQALTSDGRVEIVDVSMVEDGDGNVAASGIMRLLKDAIEQQKKEEDETTGDTPDDDAEPFDFEDELDNLVMAAVLAGVHMHISTESEDSEDARTFLRLRASVQASQADYVERLKKALNK